MTARASRAYSDVADRLPGTVDRTVSEIARSAQRAFDKFSEVYEEDKTG